MGLLYEFKDLNIINSDERWKVLGFSFLEIYKNLNGKVKSIIFYEFRSLDLK